MNEVFKVYVNGEGFAVRRGLFRFNHQRNEPLKALDKVEFVAVAETHRHCTPPRVAALRKVAVALKRIVVALLLGSLRSERSLSL